MADVLQFYPTSRRLAIIAWRKFTTPIRRLLEPSGGRGDLLIPCEPRDTFSCAEVEQLRPVFALMPFRRLVSRNLYGNNSAREPLPVDVCEVNLAHHPILRDKRYRVVGHDFLQYRGAAAYSHIIMNPPFAYGAEHVLHAWDRLYSGELVAILNAETLRKPHTQKRQLLAKIVAEFSASEPEFIEDAFLDPDTQRKTSVEVVIIHLAKKINFHEAFIDGLAKDVRKRYQESDLAYRPNALALPGEAIQNLVIAFDCAVEALQQSCIASARSSYYAGLLGQSILSGGRCADEDANDPERAARDKFNDGYEQLKEQAWSSVLRSTDIKDRLSDSARTRLEASFKEICELEFTVQNVYAFIEGLVGQQGDIQSEMCADVFDQFGAYHSDNHIHYRGWKSNSVHRDDAMRLHTTRLVLPSRSRSFYSGSSTSLAWEDERRFADFDKVFALLDGKHHSVPYGLNKMIKERMQDLIAGERCSSDYFDVRFYLGVGTFHLFPRRKDLIDRLNLIVGRMRQWIPHNKKAATDGFWQQYDQAEKINRKMDLTKIKHWQLLHGDEDSRREQTAKLDEIHLAAVAALGIDFDPNNMIAGPDVGPGDDLFTPQLPLLVA